MRYSDLLSMMVCSLSSRILSPGTVHRTHSILLGNFLTSIGATAMISKIYGFVLPVAVVHIVLFHAKGKPKEYPTNGPYHCWFYPCWVYGYYRYLIGTWWYLVPYVGDIVEVNGIWKRCEVRPQRAQGATRCKLCGLGDMALYVSLCRPCPCSTSNQISRSFTFIQIHFLYCSPWLSFTFHF